MARRPFSTTSVPLPTLAARNGAVRSATPIRRPEYAVKGLLLVVGESVMMALVRPLAARWLNASAQRHGLDRDLIVT